MIAWAIETLVATGLLMLLVLAIRAPIRRTFGPGIAYALWLLPLVRMILPPLPMLWRKVAAASLPQDTTPIARASDTITVLVAKPLGLGEAAAPAAHQPSLGLLVAALWVAGAAAFFAWHWMAHVRFCRRMLSAAVPARTTAPGVHVIESDAAAGTDQSRRDHGVVARQSGSGLVHQKRNNLGHVRRSKWMSGRNLATAC